MRMTIEPTTLPQQHHQHGQSSSPQGDLSFSSHRSTFTSSWATAQAPVAAATMESRRDPMMTSTTATTTSGSPATSTWELYVVQKCWFSGPHTPPPSDAMALFADWQHATHVAYQAAQTHAAATAAAASSSSQANVVRTLLIPAHHSQAQHHQASHYGFVSNGLLFWVRPVQATVVNSFHSSHQPQHQQATSFSQMQAAVQGAHVIVTRGVVGGTGNVHSRRGHEIAHGRVFCGSKSHAAATAALQELQRQPPGDSAVHQLQWLPILVRGTDAAGTQGLLRVHAGRVDTWRWSTDSSASSSFSSSHDDDDDNDENEIMMTDDGDTATATRRFPSEKRSCSSYRDHHPGDDQDWLWGDHYRRHATDLRHHEDHQEMEAQQVHHSFSKRIRWSTDADVAPPASSLWG